MKLEIGLLEKIPDGFGQGSVEQFVLAAGLAERVGQLDVEGLPLIAGDGS